MNHSEIVWNRYPDSIPPHPGIYLVTLERISEVLMMSYSELQWQDDGVIAWACKPAVYRESHI